MRIDPSSAAAPSSAAWPLLQGRSALAVAFALSVALHAFAWLATPHFIQAWREPPAVRFDAVLVPVVESPPASASTPKINSKNVWRGARTIAPRQAPAQPPDARFAAAENAIATIRTVDPGEENTTIAASAHVEKTPVAAEDNPGVPALPSVAEAIVAAIPRAVEMKEPDPPSPQLPSRISIAYKMSSSISDGVADYTWTRDGDNFEIDSTMQATGFIVGNFVGALHQVSRGVVTPAGLQPTLFQIRRGESAPDTADFLRESNELKLTRAGVVRLLPMPPLIQDMQSFLFQLAYDAPKMQHPDDRLEVLVTNARKVYRHRFRQVGNATVQTRSGPVPTVHLRSEAGDPEDTYEVWLATGNYHLPVKIKFYAGRFPVELIAASIRTTP